jgi:hypothetical protein
VVPEVMVPLIATKAELDLVKASIDATAETVVGSRSVRQTRLVCRSRSPVPKGGNCRVADIARPK